MKFLFAFLLFAFCSAYGSVADFTMRSANIHQRGVLDSGGIQCPVEIFIKSADTIKILLAGEFGTMAKLELSKSGEIISLDNGAFMTKSQAERFFLRDVMMAFGFFKHFYPEIIHCVVDEKFRPVYLISLDEDATILFSNYKKMGEVFVPREIEFKRKNYNLKLETIRGF